MSLPPACAPSAGAKAPLGLSVQGAFVTGEWDPVIRMRDEDGMLHRFGSQFRVRTRNRAMFRVLCFLYGTMKFSPDPGKKDILISYSKTLRPTPAKKGSVMYGYNQQATVHTHYP